MRGLTLVRDAGIVVAISTVAAFSVNALRHDGIPIVAKEPYRILVPCPEPGGDVIPLAPADVRWGDAADLVIDARPVAEAGSWSAPGAQNVPFDYLDPVSDDKLSDLLSTRCDRVVVYGDGDRPDSGEELAREISGHGVRNVHFVPGGVAAVRTHLGAQVTP
ncbi:MAG: rhodanese-like domain-containing protein [Deltaproteobacteria bacterium]|nr:rhodanese-like domain-containing protein [Deltaproteobacteria bacterium]